MVAGEMLRRTDRTAHRSQGARFASSLRRRGLSAGGASSALANRRNAASSRWNKPAIQQDGLGLAGGGVQHELRPVLPQRLGCTIDQRATCFVGAQIDDPGSCCRGCHDELLLVRRPNVE